MKLVSLSEAARDAIAARPDRAATGIVHDSPETRMVVFRLAPGQAVAPHRNPGVVNLLVLSGEGTLSDEQEERTVRTGDLAVYAPNELHGMRAGDGELHLLAIIVHQVPVQAPTVTLGRGGST